MEVKMEVKMREEMKLAIDVASGEVEQEELVRGVVEGVYASGVGAIIVGDGKRIEGVLKELNYRGDKIEIEHAQEVIGMSESPVLGCRTKKRASIMIASKLVGEGKARGLYSPGNTGATMAASVLNIQCLEGIKRPGIGAFIKSERGHTLLLDVGANIESKPKHLAQYGLMGNVFMKCFIEGKPRVGLLNVGEEADKGTELTRKAYELLEGEKNICFVGNVEGYDIVNGKVDVVVCDGFVGNALLKMYEGVGKLILSIVDKSSMGFVEVLGAKKKVKESLTLPFDSSYYGGAPLLGLKGDVIVGHGQADGRAVKNAVITCNKLMKLEIGKLIEEELSVG